MTCEAASGLRARRAVVVFALACTLVVAGCGITGDDAVQQLPAASNAEVIRQMNDVVRQIVDSAGGGTLDEPSTNPSACTDIWSDESGEVLSILLTHQISLSKAADGLTFQRIRDYWSNKGWAVTEHWYKSDAQTGSVSAEVSSGGFNFTLVSTDSPKVLALIFISGCFRDDT